MPIFFSSSWNIRLSYFWKNVAISGNFWPSSEIFTFSESASDSGSEEHLKTMVARIFPTRTLSSNFQVTDMMIPTVFITEFLAQSQFLVISNLIFTSSLVGRRNNWFWLNVSCILIIIIDWDHGSKTDIFGGELVGREEKAQNCWVICKQTRAVKFQAENNLIFFWIMDHAFLFFLRKIYNIFFLLLIVCKLQIFWIIFQSSYGLQKCKQKRYFSKNFGKKPKNLHRFWGYMGGKTRIFS